MLCDYVLVYYTYEVVCYVIVLVYYTYEVVCYMIMCWFTILMR